MGYTHYFTPKINKTQFNKIVGDVKKIEEVVELFDGNGVNKGVRYEKEGFYFNGDASKGEFHETLQITLAMEYDFCKTAMKPYDLAAVVTLLSLKFHSQKSEVKSDGDGEDWEDGLNLFKELFPTRAVSFELTPTESGISILNMKKD